MRSLRKVAGIKRRKKEKEKKKKKEKKEKEKKEGGKTHTTKHKLGSQL